jgi:hypothetical protein
MVVNFCRKKVIILAPDSIVDVWQSINRGKKNSDLPCLIYTVKRFIMLPAGFIPDLWLSINHGKHFWTAHA